MTWWMNVQFELKLHNIIKKCNEILSMIRAVKLFYNVYSTVLFNDFCTILTTFSPLQLHIYYIIRQCIRVTTL